MPDMEASAKYFSFVLQRVGEKKALTTVGRGVQADNFGLILPPNVYNSFSHYHGGSPEAWGF